MSATILVDKQQADRILLDSIDAKCRLMLTMGGANGWQTFRSSFLPRCEEGRTLSVRILGTDGSPRRLDVTPGHEAGVTFRMGHRKCMFAAPLVSLDWDGEAGEVVLRWPDRLHRLRRRAYERVAPPGDRVIPVRLTLIGACLDSPTGGIGGLDADEVRHGQLLDLSAGGLRVTVADAARFEPGSTYRCSFSSRTGRPATLVDAIVRHRGIADDGRPAIGLQIVGLEAAGDGFSALDRLARVVAYFQRARSRRKRSADTSSRSRRPD